MSGSTAKHLRAIIPQVKGDYFGRRVYRKMKKYYTRRVPSHLKAEFLRAAEIAFAEKDTETLKEMLS